MDLGHCGTISKVHRPAAQGLALRQGLSSVLKRAGWGVRGVVGAPESDLHAGKGKGCKQVVRSTSRPGPGPTSPRKLPWPPSLLLWALPSPLWQPMSHPAETPPWTCSPLPRPRWCSRWSRPSPVRLGVPRAQAVGDIGGCAERRRR